MNCYVFKFTYKDTILASGFVFNVDKIYRKNNPVYNKNSSTTLKEECQKRGISFFDTSLYYIPYDSEDEAKEHLKQVETLTEWTEFTSKTKRFDILQYKRLLINQLEKELETNKKEAEIKKFLVDNYNTEEKLLFFEENYSVPHNWDSMSHSAKKKYLLKLSRNCKWPLSVDYNIRVFSGFDSEVIDGKIIIKNKIKSDKVPYLISAMYNSIIFTAHELNQILTHQKEKKYAVSKEALPYYDISKQLSIVYNKEKYLQEHTQLQSKQKPQIQQH